MPKVSEKSSEVSELKHLRYDGTTGQFEPLGVHGPIWLCLCLFAYLVSSLAVEIVDEVVQYLGALELPRRTELTATSRRLHKQVHAMQESGASSHYPRTIESKSETIN
ncbi:hypothetical protein BDV19DRAFT_356527 [Aspergillus venezuelensis]